MSIHHLSNGSSKRRTGFRRACEEHWQRPQSVPKSGDGIDLYMLAPLSSFTTKDRTRIRRTLRVCDIVLQFATDSGKEVSDKASKRPEEATQALSRYPKRFHPDCDPTDFVEATIGPRWRTFTTRKISSFVRYSTRDHPFQNSESFGTLAVTNTVHGVSLSNKTLTSISVTLRSLDESAFTPEFFRSPTEDIWVDLQLTNNIYALVDSPGHLETKKQTGASATSGAEWLPDLQSCLRPITTNPSANPTLGFSLEDWARLNRPASHSSLSGYGPAGAANI
ncbi:hypothetical protein H4582DRAFT_2057979 [Lactarius indigo]|nr:hypothetical protein H4582DRAFT_2057979 [Lactarius indigo]